VTEAHHRPDDLLVIGYGNELRRDDGVGPKLARAVAEKNWPGVSIIACHQLTPELAEPISRVHAVVFVDATADGSTEVRARDLTVEPGAQIMTHAADPQSLLALAWQVFAACPRAWWVTIPVTDLGFGDMLSPLAQRGLETALEKVHELRLSL
jgi:hydrogenase maturation protease